jgi:hypothetical protein
MKPYRHRRIALRALCVALLLAVVAMPVLLAAGELHELDHHAQAGHPPAAHSADHGGPGELPPPSEAPGQWHLLIHLAHCCGQAAALLPATLLIDDLRQIAFVAGREPSPRLSTAQHRLLRPPITG